MSEVEHYFENLIFDGEDVKSNCNKDYLSKEVQEAVEECAAYIVAGLLDGSIIFNCSNPPTPIRMKGEEE